MKDIIYPSMVIRSQAEAIELLEKENKELREELDNLKLIEQEHKRMNGELMKYCKRLEHSLKYYKQQSASLKKLCKQQLGIDFE